MRPRVQGLCGVMTVGRGEECGMVREAGKLRKKGLQGFGRKGCSVQYFENVGVTGVEVAGLPPEGIMRHYMTGPCVYNFHNVADSALAVAV
nr:hypothetical protein [Tanacetum cinerariifolium]